MSVSYWNDKSCDHHLNFDITIIGGGISGLSSAYWLNKLDPSLKIALIEKYELAAGATGRNAGFITCGSVEHFSRLISKYGKEEALKIWRFSELNLKLLEEEIIQDFGISLDFEKKGSFSLASSESELEELTTTHSIMLENGIRAEILNEEDIKKRLGAYEFVGGIKYIDDASIHPVKLLNRIKDKLGENVTIFFNNEVKNIETVNGNKVVTTQKNIFTSDIVILGTNGYSPLLHPYFKNKVYPTRAQILATSKVPRFMEGPCYANFVLDYFRQLPSGEVIIGGFRQLQKNTETGYSDETSEIIQKALEDFLGKHLPNLKNAKITHRWSGVMGFSVDGMPIVGSLPDNPSIFFQCAYTGHGLGLAFKCAESLANTILHGRSIESFISSKRFL